MQVQLFTFVLALIGGNSNNNRTIPLFKSLVNTHSELIKLIIWLLKVIYVYYLVNEL